MREERENRNVIKESENKKETELKIPEEFKKAIKELEELHNEIDKSEKELIDFLKREDKPRKIKKAFITTEKLIEKIKNRILNIKKIPEITELQEPVLLLMKENGYMDTIENVKAGEFTIQTTKAEKTIQLTPEKLVSWNCGDKKIKTWVAYENCMSPYPENPIHNAEMYRKTTQKLAMNWRDRDETDLINATTKRWLYIIGAIVIGLVLLLSTDFGKNLIAGIGKEQATTIAQTAITNITNTTTQITGGIKIT